jgi:glycosyltransferase involved in cell wall biosynthesis
MPVKKFKKTTNYKEVKKEEKPSKVLSIWIDGKEANVPQRLGSGQVAFELIRNLEKIDHKNKYTIVLPTDPMEDLPKERDGWTYRVIRPNRLWTLIALPYTLMREKNKPDLIFSPTHYIPRFSNVKRIVTIFDLSYLHFPQMFKKDDLYKLTNWSKYAIENASHIVTISQTTKKDIIKNYQIQKDKITVAYPGYDNQHYSPGNDPKRLEELRLKYHITKDYIIFVGTIQPRKNISLLIETIADIKDLQLVIVGKTSGEGKKGWMYEEILSKPNELGIEDKVIFTGFTPTEDVVTLVRGAKAFVLPSLWEGFGIPAVDALACGTPVIVSNVSSLPEVVGEAGLLINPKSKDQLQQAIRTIISDQKIRKAYAKKGIQQAKKFGWSKMARTVLKVFEEVG